MLRVAIVDDEAPARRYLRRMIEGQEGSQVVGEAADVQTAIELVDRLRPDAVFLDVELARGTSFDVLKGVSWSPCIVFVTAHADYAPRAFDVDAADYLLKPVSPKRLQETMRRLHERLQHDAADSSFLTIRSRRGGRIVRVQALTALVAQRDYVKLHGENGQTFRMHTTLKRLVPQLPAPPFQRLSRSVVINLDHVARIDAPGGQPGTIYFLNGALPLSCGRTALVRLSRALAERK